MTCMAGRSPHGERGLKFAGMSDSGANMSRSPHGERGLKLNAAYPVGSAAVALLTESVD